MTVVDQAVRKFADETDWPAPRVIDEAIQWLEDNEPQALKDWLWEHRNAILVMYLGARERSRRTTARAQTKRRTFSKMVADEDTEQINHYQVRFVIDDEGTRRKTADMVGADHRYVANNYDASGTYDLLLAEFHRQIAKRVGRRRTEDALTEQQYDRLFCRIVDPQ